MFNSTAFGFSEHAPVCDARVCFQASLQNTVLRPPPPPIQWRARGGLAAAVCRHTLRVGVGAEAPRNSDAWPRPACIPRDVTTSSNTFNTHTSRACGTAVGCSERTCSSSAATSSEREPQPHARRPRTSARGVGGGWNARTRVRDSRKSFSAAFRRGHRQVPVLSFRPWTRRTCRHGSTSSANVCRHASQACRPSDRQRRYCRRPSEPVGTGSSASPLLSLATVRRLGTAKNR